MRPKPQFPVSLVTFTEEILNGKLHFLGSALDSVALSSFPLFECNDCH